MTQPAHAAPPPPPDPADAEPRVLMLSLRNLQRHPTYCIVHEFEQLIERLDMVEVIAPRPASQGPLRLDLRQANTLARKTSLALRYNPADRRYRPPRRYPLFFFHCSYPGDLLYLNAIPGWRQACDRAVCLIDEIWIRRIAEGGTRIFRLLEPFDQVFVSVGSSVPALNEATGLAARHLPFAVDTLTFGPLPWRPQRGIDVYSIGPQPAPVHAGLAQLARERDFHYLYDTSSVLQIARERRGDHRQLYANNLKRSRYFLAYRAKVNQSERVRAQEVAGARYVEGAAAGSVLLGGVPADPTFDTLFDWPDAVLPLPEDSADVAGLIAGYDAQPERLEQIRWRNVTQCLLRHDWAYRWQHILDSAGLSPQPALSARLERLHEVAETAAGYLPLGIAPLPERPFTGLPLPASGAALAPVGRPASPPSPAAASVSASPASA